VTRPARSPDFDLLISLAGALSVQWAWPFLTALRSSTARVISEPQWPILTPAWVCQVSRQEKWTRALFTRAAVKAESGDRAGALVDYDAILALDDVPQEYRAHASNLRDNLFDPSDNRSMPHLRRHPTPT
jgi:hypothetical protein